MLLRQGLQWRCRASLCLPRPQLFASRWPPTIRCPLHPPPTAGRAFAAAARPPQDGSASTPKSNAGANVSSETAAALALIWSLWPTEVSHNARIVFAATGLIAGKVLAILAPLQLGHLVDALGVGVEALPLGILAAYGLARLSTSAFNELRAALFATVSQASCRALAKRGFQHLHSLDAAFLISSKPGALSVIVSRATKSLTQVLNMTLFNLMPIVVEFALALGVMASLAGPVCALTAAGTVGAYTAFTTYFSNRRRVIMRRANKAEENSTSVFFDSLTNCEVVKYFQSEAYETTRYDAAVAKYETEQINVLHSLAQLNFGQQIIVVSGFTAILGLSAQQVLSGALPLGDVVAVHGILAQLMQPLGILGGVYRVTTQGMLDLGKLSTFLEREASVVAPAGGGAAFEFRGGGIEFRDVLHSYADGTAPVLAGASLAVAPGSRVAIVGPSGSGKSTLFRLLYRLADPASGQVLVDGQDVRDLDLTSFRKYLGIVPQDCTLFNESVGFNIRYGRPDASEADVQRAAELAQIHEMVEGMPEGYDTPVGERGLKLSGGERQRIGIARCFLRDPSIFLLDEATSSLDVQTEQRLAEAVDEWTRGRTCLFITHRLVTAQRCDSVAFLEHGAVVATGPHDELIETSERYRQFWEGAGNQ